jgi:hypothetical protein
MIAIGPAEDLTKDIIAEVYKDSRYEMDIDGLLVTDTSTFQLPISGAYEKGDRVELLADDTTLFGTVSSLFTYNNGSTDVDCALVSIPHRRFIGWIKANPNA